MRKMVFCSVQLIISCQLSYRCTRTRSDGMRAGNGDDDGILRSCHQHCMIRGEEKCFVDTLLRGLHQPASSFVCKWT